MSGPVFFCYARANQEFVLRLAGNLKQRGVAVWLDQWDIPAESDWDQTIDQALRNCAHLLIVLSPASVESREVRGELRTALDLGKPILPVLYQPCEVPRQLRLVQFVDFSGREPEDERALDKLLIACLAQPTQSESVRKATLTSSTKLPGTKRPNSLSARSKVLLAALAALLVVAIGWYAIAAIARDHRTINDVALSPSGTYLAAATGQGMGHGIVRVWDVTSQSEVQRIRNAGNGPFWVVAWSPKGDKLSAGDHEGKIGTYESGTWKLLNELTGPRGPVNFIAWSPDGAAIATGDDSGTLWVWDVSDGKLRFYSALHSKEISSASWSPDGRRLATASWDGSVGIVDARTGKLLNRFEAQASYVNSVAWSPDGNSIASGNLQEPYVLVWDAAGKARKLEGHRNSVERVAWSSDGLYLASASKDNTIQTWDGRTFNNLGRFNLGGQYNSGKSLAWSKDGTRLASGDNANVWILNPKGDAVQKLVGSTDDPYNNIEIGGWSADGKRLASYNRYQGIARTWDTVSGQSLGTFRVSLFEALID
jgi:WD40 repeat protein